MTYAIKIPEVSMHIQKWINFQIIDISGDPATSLTKIYESARILDNFMDMVDPEDVITAFAMSDDASEVKFTIEYDQAKRGNTMIVSSQSFLLSLETGTWVIIDYDTI